ncbi:hypothetical protein CgunFtcFv8_003461 [Champsocephalus gunnari]|uniref:Uncharacterized protein n=1 Tax=Champsocephalus gunnari TaxID=52237 RepID=A0AAN8HJK1_CHAGU|nr:hypothetical protein CgunFtcFv8_003461 [Champsocephalus gunnari]
MSFTFSPRTLSSAPRGAGHGSPQLSETLVRTLLLLLVCLRAAWTSGCDPAASCPHYSSQCVDLCSAQGAQSEGDREPRARETGSPERGRQGAQREGDREPRGRETGSPERGRQGAQSEGDSNTSPLW